MSRFVSVTLRQIVAERAHNHCEYCGIPQVGRFISFHVEHIKSLKHGGQTVLENLALSCPSCNFNKGSDIGTFIGEGTLVRFFNPRIDNWTDHFELLDGEIIPNTDIGEATTRILQFNTPERIIYRREQL